MSTNKIVFVAALNAAIVIAQLLIGSYANSTALITDAFHNFGDVLALLVSLAAFRLGQKPASNTMTFGYMRAEMIATFVNSLFLCLSMLFVFVEAIHSLLNPEELKPIPVIFAAAIGIIANGLGAWILGGHHHHGASCNHSHDLNIHSSFLHLLGDALISACVLISAVIVWMFGIGYMDALISIAIGIYIFKESFSLLKTSFLSLLDVNTDDLQKVCDEICSCEGVHSVHDVHIYRPSSKDAHLSAHIVFNSNPNLAQTEQTLETIRYKLAKQGINHVVLQAETVKYAMDDVLCTMHK